MKKGIEVGEIADDLLQQIEEEIGRIHQTLQHRTEKYWIVIALKPSSSCYLNKPVMYLSYTLSNVKPLPLASTLVFEIDPVKGIIEGLIHDLDVPLDYNRIPGLTFSSEKKYCPSKEIGHLYRY